MDPCIQELNTCSEDLASPVRTLGDLPVHFHVIKQHSLRYSGRDFVHNRLDTEETIGVQPLGKIQSQTTPMLHGQDTGQCAEAD
ncbi:hypothetical protein N7530_006413 [Penicillium desertorum]|jgi:hypothetical protein|uniref:Uncharacterized protein n=1 Tax=Penicillium desertorum TaxID=1303715 RepID=A0A9W9WSG7_9EURO|nr:hypothetical protein N7530_006413 [Penicillium desertorum]